MSKYIQGKIGEDGYASQTGWVKTYCINESTREHMGESMEYVVIGGGLPAGAFLDAPKLPEKDDMTIVRSEDGLSWLHVADHRGKTAYNTETRQPLEIDFIGDLPDTLTLLEPKTEFDKWNGKKWVTDTEAQKDALIAQAESTKQSLLAETTDAIAPLQDAVDLDMATDEEEAFLKEWKKYRVLLNRVDTSTAPDVEFPEKPNAIGH